MKTLLEQLQTLMAGSSAPLMGDLDPRASESGEIFLDVWQTPLHRFVVTWDPSVPSVLNVQDMMAEDNEEAVLKFTDAGQAFTYMKSELTR